MISTVFKKWLKNNNIQFDEIGNAKDIGKLYLKPKHEGIVVNYLKENNRYLNSYKILNNSIVVVRFIQNFKHYNKNIKTS